MNGLSQLVYGSGLYNLEWGQAVMMAICLGLLFLAIRKGFEPLLLLPIGFGGLLANIPEAGLAMSAVENAIHLGSPEQLANLAAALNIPFDVTQAVTPEIRHEFIVAYKGAHAAMYQAVSFAAQDMGFTSGMLYQFFNVAIMSGVAPLLIFMGVGAMTDFGPLLANPKTLMLGAAAQFGIFGTVLGAAALDASGMIPFSIKEAAAIGIIGGADGPTSIYVATLLAPHLLGAIAVAAYSYMALVPLIQPPIMKALTNDAERKIKMEQLRHVTKAEKIVFPIILLILVAMFLPDAAPLLGMFCFGNLMRECGVVDRLSDTSQNALINIVTIILGLSVGSKLSADKFLDVQTLGILVLGMLAFCVGTASGVLMAKLMNKLPGTQVNPLIGSAGVSAVPMAARVSNKVGLEANPQNFLLMHAMGPNVAGVIGSAVAAGVMIKFLS
ncbi:sodium ion-translocating decarboxylase subunit beta [Hahella sp. KA22]|uniref:sodium ion-translocating decarboxylase subunit beta n=1 Tax=Hahella sp. KA22 TaxID=1628392 RepID=UPI000FDE3FEA|nr:sodium ion-translocating decarboxylase subunit beta [Hahella sp. KA22]AZZ90961.1 sodium ion-translocating decarboxylase subunit beta [Hahella sp. KA22]QAY54331.1 sodium ion-translocating decarboxylase subunit beta [Hahella sp. KA22]